MLQPEKTLVNYNQQLAMEAERVLEDLIFKRAPIQTRLLRYLVDRALSGEGPPTQYEIAVDALGKGDDYDLEADSYPRVQMSRVRRNLENYYARNLPGNGLKIQIDSGSYALALVPAKGLTPSETDGSAEPPMGSALTSERKRSRLLVGLATFVAFGLGLISLMLFGGYFPSGAPGPQEPAVALIIDSEQSLAGLGLPEKLTDTARQVSEIQLASSFVSKPLPLGGSAEDAEYSLSLNFAPENGDDFIVYLSLAAASGEVLYANKIPFKLLADKEFRAELEASLVYITSPNGSIAKAELSESDAFADSDYICFLAIENRRSNGRVAANLVDECIERYPKSSYRPFWYARRAFTRFQKDIAEGRTIEKSGKGWADLQIALDADRYNAFANFAAAKVELANGQCAQARGYVNRALERGGSYPVLIAAVETNAASCSTTDDDLELASRLRALARFNPDPDPLLHLYLVAGLLAADDRETAKLVAQRAIIEDPQGPVELTSDLLRRSLADPTYGAENRQKIENALYLFVWNERVANDIVDKILE